jgi:FlaG/FlaF family flagellin (archaellin)
MRLASAIAICVAALLLSLQARGQAPSPAPPPATSQATTPIGMGPTRMTVAEILAALRAQPDVTFVEKDGQLIAADQPSTHTHYVFVTKGSAAYPAVGMTHLYVVGASVKMNLNVVCQAETAPCDAFFASMQRYTEQFKNTAARQPGYIGQY